MYDINTKTIYVSAIDNPPMINSLNFDNLACIFGKKNVPNIVPVSIAIFNADRAPSPKCRLSFTYGVMSELIGINNTPIKLPTEQIINTTRFEIKYDSPCFKSPMKFVFSASGFLFVSFIDDINIAEKRKVAAFINIAPCRPDTAMITPKAAIPSSDDTLVNDWPRDVAIVYFSFGTISGKTPMPAGIRKASNVDISRVEIARITGVICPSIYRVATILTSTARHRSVTTMIAFLSMRSTHTPTNGINNMVGSEFNPKITADHERCPVISYTIHANASASIASPNLLITFAINSFIKFRSLNNEL